MVFLNFHSLFRIPDKSSDYIVFCLIVIHKVMMTIRYTYRLDRTLPSINYLFYSTYSSLYNYLQSTFAFFCCHWISYLQRSFYKSTCTLQSQIQGHRKELQVRRSLHQEYNIGRNSIAALTIAGVATNVLHPINCCFHGSINLIPITLRCQFYVP